ncbi:MAG TPA: TIM barrel protein [Vicinamibacteria bacterium]|nr:TIM barrel protein [Vicinamibacteria bacterium]
MKTDPNRRDFLKASLAGALGATFAGRWALAASPGLASRLAVCSWSLEPASIDDLLKKLAPTGLRRVQIALDPLRENKGGAWSDAAAKASAQGVTFVSGMMGTIGEDYTTLDSIRRTGGVVPDATWADNWKNIQRDAEIAAGLGVKLVTFHAGFLPHEETDPSSAKLQDRVRRIADLFQSKGITLGMETGQEVADTLALFLRRLGHKGVGVNLDPANIILYDKGDPVAAVRTLGPWIKQCHVKDAVRTRVPGTWGEEVVLGTGQIDWKAFFKALSGVGFTGNLCIEREAGTERVADIKTAREYVERLSLQ